MNTYIHTYIHTYTYICTYMYIYIYISVDVFSLPLGQDLLLAIWSSGGPVRGGLNRETRPVLAKAGPTGSGGALRFEGTEGSAILSLRVQGTTI